MAITIDWVNKIVESTSSILDLPAFKDTIRDYEDDAIGMLYQPVISYKRVDLGGGGFFHAVDFINGYQLKFPNPGNYTINGNLGATIVPVAGVYVERKTSAAFATSSSGGGGGLTTEQASMLEELYRIQGLAAGVPMTVNKTSGTRVAGSIVLEVTGTEEIVTVERQ